MHYLGLVNTLMHFLRGSDGEGHVHSHTSSNHSSEIFNIRVSDNIFTSDLCNETNHVKNFDFEAAPQAWARKV